MALDYDRLMNWHFEDIHQPYTQKDTILYALGLGLGADPLDEDQLRFTYERDLQALPTMSVVLAGPGFWLKDPGTGVNWKMVLHGEQGIEMLEPLPAVADVVGKTRITAIIDKGADKGALLLSERDIVDAKTGTIYAKTTSTTFLRRDGGFGGSPDGAPVPHKMPDRAPDVTDDWKTAPQAALIYRLSGDYNPLHADPDVAKTAGFRAPILHGLCSLGVAGHSLLRKACGYDATRMKSLKLRFTSPVYPGETIRTEMWIDGSDVSFRARVVERDKVVLDNGHASVA